MRLNYEKSHPKPIVNQKILHIFAPSEDKRLRRGAPSERRQRARQCFGGLASSWGWPSFMKAVRILDTIGIKITPDLS